MSGEEEDEADMISQPALFVCDIQTKFSGAIHSWNYVVATAQKMLKAAQILSIPVYYTTQLRAKLGDTVDELKMSSATADFDKSLFSMCLPEILAKLPPGSSVAIVGIESHICVTQTALDLMQHGHRVYVLADGVSSCNEEEVPIALRRLQQAGATITTSESFIYEAVHDASVPEFKSIANLVKESKDTTRSVMQNMPGCKI